MIFVSENITRLHAEPPATSAYDFSLSVMDDLMQSTYTQMFVAYYCPADAAPDEFMNSTSLRASLIRVLSDWWAFSGRLSRDITTGISTLLADNKGITFETQHCKQTLEECGIGQPVRFDQIPLELRGHMPVRTTPDGPLLWIVVTRFTCGSVVIYLGLNHLISDGAGLHAFMSTWTEQHCNNNYHGEQPILDRERLQRLIPATSVLPHPEYSVLSGGELAKMAGFSPPAYKTGLFAFSPARLQQLKTDTAIDNNSRLSTNDALSALVWRASCRARSLEDETTTLALAVNGRTRLQPPLPANYIGNVSFLAYPKMRARELTELSLADSARIVRRSHRQLTDSFMKDSLAWLKQQTNRAAVMPAIDLFSTDLLITSWAQFPLYDLDFGFGKPVYAGMPGSLGVGALAIIVRAPDNGLYLYFSLPRGQMDRFADDYELSRYAVRL